MPLPPVHPPPPLWAAVRNRASASVRADRLTVSALLRWLPPSSVRLLRTLPTCRPTRHLDGCTIHHAAVSPIRQPRHAISSCRALSTLSTVPADSDSASSPSASTGTDLFSSSSSASLQPWTNTQSLDELRSKLRTTIPKTTTLLALIQQVQSDRSLLAQLTPSDYSLLCHHLSLHNGVHYEYRALTCLSMMGLYDHYCARELQAADDSESGWGRGWRRELMTDTLNVCSRTGEGEACELVVTNMVSYGLAPTAHDMNAALWGLRGKPGVQWLWYELMQQVSRALATGQQPTDSPRALALYRVIREGDALARDCDRFRPGSATLLILMHSAALSLRPNGEHDFRLDFVLRRLTPTEPFFLPSAAPATTLLFNQLISLSSVMDRDEPLRFARRVHSLFRLANELKCPLTERSLRLAVGAAHILQHRWASRRNSHESTAAAAAAAAADQQSNDSTPVDSWWQSLHPDSSPDGVQFANDVVVAFEASGMKVGPSSALLFDLQTATAPWQRVLELFDWVQVEGGHINMQRALTAIEACYKGKHWQQALSILVLPKWAKTFIHGSDTAAAAYYRNNLARPATQSPSDRANTQLSHPTLTEHTSTHASIVAIEWLPSEGRWSGPQHDRLVWTKELKDEPWLLFTPVVEVTSTDAAVPSLTVDEAPATPRSSVPLLLPPLSYPVTVLHIAYTIAAMDEAANAEALLKADRLHAMALRLLPFLGYIYQHDTNTIHLHHPPTPLDTVNTFVQQPRNQRAKLFALLYLVFRIMRRRFMDNPVTADSGLIGLSALCGHRLHGLWGVSKESAKQRWRTPLRFRVASEEEAHTLQQLLAQPPFELRARRMPENGLLGTIRRFRLSELAGTPVKAHEKQPIERAWWKAMHQGQRMDQEVIVLQISSDVWYRTLQTTLEEDEDDDQL